MFGKKISFEKADIKAFVFVRNPTKFVKKEMLKKIIGKACIFDWQRI
ncbi:hypothetical protein ACFC84_08665 [Enterococcus casseliflavus]